MGTSTDAILFYGIDLGEDGLDSIYESNKDLYDAIQDCSLPDEMVEKLKDNLCEIGYHCSGECPMYYIFASKERAWRGYPQEIENLDVDLIWNDQLKEFCEVIGIEYQKPKWYLASYWS